VAKCWLRRLIGSDEIVRNPSLKSDRDRRRHLTALQGQVAGADQTAHLAVARTVRHRSPMRARARCACTRLAAADLKRVMSASIAMRFVGYMGVAIIR